MNDITKNKQETGLVSGKYIVIRTDIFEAFNEKKPADVQSLSRLIQKHPEAVLFDEGNEEDEFFVLMLKDRYAYRTLLEYARNAFGGSQHKLSHDVMNLTHKALTHPLIKIPD